MKKTSDEIFSPQFSILVPVYNVQAYLDSCINSVLNQSYANWELVLVNDGSTDSSAHICQQYADKDSRIQLVHQENRGLLSARRTGIKQARGEYLLFLDSDDFLATDLLAYLHAIIQEHAHIDLILFNYKKVNMSGQFMYENKNPFGKTDEVYSIHRTLLRNTFLEGNKLNPLCLKVVHRKLMQKDQCDYLRFGRLMQAEDRLQSLPLIWQAQKAIYIDRAFYHYRTNPVSTSFNFRRQNFDDTLRVEIEMERFLIAAQAENAYVTKSYAYTMYAIVGAYLRLISSNSFSRLEKLKIIHEVQKSSVFVNAKKWLSLKLRFFHFLFSHRQIRVLDFMAQLNKLRLKKQARQ
jgi:glycosyltransferase involved in cell wall biosynthesis